MTENNFDHRGEYDRAVRIANAIRLLLLVLTSLRDTGTLQAAVQVSRTVRDLRDRGVIGEAAFKPHGVLSGHFNPIAYAKELRSNPEAMEEQVATFSAWSLETEDALRHLRLLAEAAAYLDPHFVGGELETLNDERYRWAIGIASDVYNSMLVRI